MFAALENLDNGDDDVEMPVENIKASTTEN
jgi:hypothetical protein